MPPRRTHKKSRLGCQECKKRKVKCNEARPTCSYCIRASCPCIYPVSSRPLASKTLLDTIPSSTLSSQNPTTTKPSETSFDMLDLTLMNHFTAITALAMFSGLKQRLVWQTDIHFKARSHPLLMHGILSVAAIHLSLLEPENLSLYRLRALHHHDLGVRLFNTQLSTVTSNTSHVLFAFAVMLVVWVYASSVIAEEELQLHDILNLLELVRGCKTIFMLNKDSIVGTPISSITDFFPRPKSHEMILSSVALRAFQNLRLRVSDAIYEHAIERLENVFMKALGEPDDVRTVVAWPCLVDEEVWGRLRRNDTETMFLLAHYAMLLERYENQWWWLSGWSRRILQTVGYALSDGDKASLGWDAFLSYVEEHRQELLDKSACRMS